MNSVSNLDIYASSGPPVDDLAREAWLLEQAAEGRISVLVTSWERPVVVLGYAQKVEEVDLDFCRAEGMPVLRRLTGGTGVIHSGDLGVGLALPVQHPWAKGIVGLYGRFLDVLGPALRSLGSDVFRLADPARASRVRSPVCFLDQLSDTLVIDGKKVVGCAQTWRGGTVLIHAAILLGLDVDLYEQVFQVSAEEIRAGLTPALPGGDPLVVGEAVAGALAEALGLHARPRPLEPIPDRFLAPYESARWSPVG